ncbi:MAG: beta-ketoacyl-ACP synthase II [Chloroflexi bacterium]|nr:beta-ketoacyl-ACP synthase II [Chloroflexota bacterium]
MDHRVAVTGIGIVSPLGLDTASTWKALLAGKSGVDRITGFDPEEFETKIAAEVTDFDPLNYMDRKEAKRNDRFVQLATAAALEALRHSGLAVEGPEAESIGCVVGSGIGGIGTLSKQVQVLHERGPSRVSPFLVPMMIADMASGHLSIRFGAKGPNFCTTSACSSGADALGVSAELIQRGDAVAMIAGGAEACVVPVGVAGFSSAGALSKRNDEPTKASRPFDADRDGFVLGEGAGILILEELEHARARGVEILAEIVGYGATADAHHITQPADRAEGAQRAMRIAMRKACLRTEDVDYVNAHGTSTLMNDKFETMAIKDVFGDEAYRILVSSTKSMTGHLIGAAGAIEAAFSVLAIKDCVVPPTINLETPDPDCDLNYVPHIPRKGVVRAALSNSLGFGGHNSCLAFRRYEA